MKKEEKKIEVNNINIKMGDKNVTLKVEEALRLHDALNKLFRSLETKESHVHHYHWWWGYPTQQNPVWTIIGDSTLGNISIENNNYTYSDGPYTLTGDTVTVVL